MSERHGSLSNPQKDKKGRIPNFSGYEINIPDVEKAQGPWLMDARGGRYLDLEAGVWCLGLGHNCPEVSTAIREQAAGLFHVGLRYASPVAELAADKIATALGMETGKVLFLSSGSEAVEFCVQAARTLTPKPLLLTLAHAFLASYGDSAQADPAMWRVFDWEPCRTCDCGQACKPDCAYLNDLPLEEIGAFVFEPGSSSGRVLLPPAPPVKAISERVRAAGGLVVVDEVTTGMGRTGTWFGFEHYRLAPDLVALGKMLGNGYPVSAVAMSKAACEALQERGFHYAQSHMNDPSGCAAALAVFSVMEKRGLVERSAALGDWFLRRLEKAAAPFRETIEIRGRGLMAAMAFKQDPATPDPAIVHRKLLDRGYLAGYKPEFRLLRFYPPLNTPKEALGGLASALGEIFLSWKA